MRTSTALALALCLIALTGCRPTPGTGKVAIRLAADIRNKDQLKALEVVIEAAGVHRVGRPIDTDWITWQPDGLTVDLIDLGQGETIGIGSGEVPAGRYDRARVVVEAGSARTADGDPVPLTLTVEPIAIPFELKNDDQIEITIEFIALTRVDGSYELFTKSAVIHGR